jgi:hypothetical protein
MTAAAATPERSVLVRATELVDLGLKACEAYKRPDLGARLAGTRKSLADPSVHIVVVGEFKQGKSSLVNALVGANVCPVDDDVATAVPTYVRQGPAPKAELMLDGDKPRREPIELDQVRGYVVEGGAGTGGAAAAGRVAGVEIQLPRKVLGGGLVMVDTPGVGGLGSAHAAASLAAISLADAVIFVTGAAQEFTRTELDFLRQARELCGTVVCALTKIDFYPAWRTIAQLNQHHLRGVNGSGIPLMPVSSTLRTRAVKASDTALNTESGFAELVKFVTSRVGGGAAERIVAEVASDVAGVCDQLLIQFEAERSALADPEAAQQVIQDLTALKSRVEGLRSAAAKWNQTLNDGVADLNADIDFDLRARIRQVIQEAEDAVENVDPADTWSEMQPWLESRVAYELLGNYRLLRDRADQLSDTVGQHFAEASAEVLEKLSVYNPTPLLSRTRVEHKIELDKMKAGKQAMVALKSAYGGALMFTMLGALTGIVLGPLAIGIGLVMGHKGLRDEKKRQLLQRRSQAKNAIRRYCDEVLFVMGKDSRDTLRRIQRQLRDHYSTLADELNRSNSTALNAATEAARRTQTGRDKRLSDLNAELTRLRQLRAMAVALAPAVADGSAA